MARIKVTGKQIPIQTAQKIAHEFGYTQVIIHAYDGDTGIQCVATFGKSLQDCANAAKGGNEIKKLLGWSPELCEEKPVRLNRKLPKPPEPLKNKLGNDNKL